MDKDKLTNFLQELTDLSMKYGLIISGCGECGSPWVEERTQEYQAAFGATLQWQEPEEAYKHEH